MEVFPHREVQRGFFGFIKLGGISAVALGFLLRGACEGQENVLRKMLEVFLLNAQHMIKEKVDIIGVFQGMWITGICSQGRHVTSLL